MPPRNETPRLHPHPYSSPPAGRVIRPCKVLFEARLGHVQIHMQSPIHREVLLDLVVNRGCQQEHIVRTALESSNRRRKGNTREMAGTGKNGIRREARTGAQERVRAALPIPTSTAEGSKQTYQSDNKQELDMKNNSCQLDR